MEQSRKDQDLEVIRERQAFITSQTRFLAEQRSHQNRWILWARASGATFVELGDALGVSWQAAQERHDKARAQRDAATLEDLATEVPAD